MSEEINILNVLELHMGGYSYSKISKQTGVPRSTVSRWIKNANDDK